MRILSLFLIPLVLLGACDDDDQDNDIFQIDVSDGSGSAVLKAGESGKFVLIPFSGPTSSSIGGDANYEVSISKVAPLEKLAPPEATSKFVHSLGPPSFKWATVHANARLAFEKQRHADFQQTLHHFNQYQAAHPNQSLKYKNAPPGDSSVSFAFGSSLNIFSPYSGELNAAIEGDLLASNGTVAIYVDSRDSGQMSPGTAASLLAVFSQISVPRVRAFTGTEGDINNDGGLVVFLSDKTPSGVLGFFRPLDMLPDGVDPSIKSNEMEIVYAALPSSGSGDTLFHATLAHEYFHLVNFAVKSLPEFVASGGGSILAETTYLNEGMAHVIEDLVGWGGGDTYAVAAEFLSNLDLASIAGAVDASIKGSASASNDTLARRGGMMLFIRYLFEQAGGATYSSTDAGSVSGGGVDFMRTLTSSSRTGMANIEATAGDEMLTIMGDWLATLYLDGQGFTTSARYNYEDEVTDSFTLGPRGFDMQGSRQINGGSLVTLSGPSITSSFSANVGATAKESGSYFISGANFLKLTTAPNSEATLNYQVSPDTGAGLTVIVVPD